MSERLDVVRENLTAILKDILDDGDAIAKIASRAVGNLPRDVMPYPNQSAVIALGLEKTAALCYDRVWSFFSDVPSDVGFFCGTYGELRIFCELEMEILLHEVLKVGSKEVSEQLRQRIRNRIAENRILRALRSEPRGLAKEELLAQINSVPLVLGASSRAVSSILAKECNLTLPTVYNSVAERDIEYQPGDARVVVTCLTNIALPDEEVLSWEQVAELRRDPESLARYRRFIHWLNKEMVGRPSSFIQDEITGRLEQYTWAVKKHGIKTVTGSLLGVFDEKGLLTMAGGALAGLAAGNALAGLISAACILGGRAALKVSEALVDLRDIKLGEGSEISFVYDLHERVR